MTTATRLQGALAVVLLTLTTTCRAAVAATLKPDEVAAVERFRQFLRLNTSHPNPSYQASVDFIVSQAKEIGLPYEILELAPNKPSVLITYEGQDPTLPAVFFNSHTDTVPAEAAKWRHPPWAAEWAEDGKIYALGAQDMKCVGMQHLEALRALRAAAFRPLRRLLVTFTPDEEIGGVDGLKALAESPRWGQLNVGLALVEGLASTTPEYRVYNGERAPWRLVLQATGAPGHGSRVLPGSAMENLLLSLHSVMEFRAAEQAKVDSGEAREGDVVSVNVVFLKAGTPTPTGFVMNVQPSEASAGVDIRVPPGYPTETLEERAARDWAPAERNMTHQWLDRNPTQDRHGRPLSTPADASNPWWRAFAGAVARAGGRLQAPENFPAATDGRHVRLVGTPVIGFSPMASTPVMLHDHNEFLDASEYVRGISMFQAIMEDLGNFSEGDRHTEL